MCGFGVAYNPSNGDLELSKIQLQHTETEASFSNWGDKEAAETLADTNRENGFAILGTRATASVNYYQSTDAPDNRIKDAKEFLRKLRGRRAKALVDDPNTPEDESQGGNSVAQLSYVQKVEHLNGLIDLYTADGMYSPNEDDIKVTTLTTLRDALQDFNTGSMNANTNTAAARSEFFVKAYTSENNMIDTAMQVNWQSCLDVESGRGKLPLRHALARTVRHQSTAKRGFEVPMGQWLRSSLRDVFEQAVMSRDNLLGVAIDRRALRKLYDRHVDGTEGFAWGLWPLLSLALWERRYVSDRTTATCM